jgi:exopolyphosphatase/guanosine-5'-triphosphate,3'-diphosphate pyrophosphatase
MTKSTGKRTNHERWPALPGIEETFYRYHADQEHACQVCRLSLRLFDELKSLHRLGGHERNILKYAALFHDLGWIGGVKAHHKKSREIILGDPHIPLKEDERQLVGAVARYHRKSLPGKRHEEYAALTSTEQTVVSTLAAILRVADGLDAFHDTGVTDLYCRITEDSITIHCSLKDSSLYNLQEAEKKADLMRLVFRREVVTE